MREYKLNSEMPWTLIENGHPHPHVPFLGLNEQDTCDPTQYPTVFKLVYEPEGEHLQKYRLLEFDKETEEEFLNTNYDNIVAWRYLTDHAGTFDKWFAEHPEEDVSRNIKSKS